MCLVGVGEGFAVFSTFLSSVLCETAGPFGSYYLELVNLQLVLSSLLIYRPTVAAGVKRAMEVVFDLKLLPQNRYGDAL